MRLISKMSLSLMVLSPFVFAGPLSASATEGQIYKAANPLGENRILAVCVPEENTSIESKYSVMDWDGFNERDLVIVEVGHKTTDRVIFDDRLELMILNPIADKRASIRLTSIASCGEALEFVLIGKDQGVKQRWDNFPSFKTLYSIIDAMPMRRFEMRQKRRDG